MGSIELTVTREAPDDSSDHTVTVHYERDAYGIDLLLDEADAKVIGQLTDSERDQAMTSICELEGESA